MRSGLSIVARTAVAVVAAFVAGVGGAVWWMTRPAPTSATMPTSGASASATGAEAGLTLSPEAISRAGIRTAPVEVGRGRETRRVPAVVEPNQYRTAVVTSIAAGRVTGVTAAMGDDVTEGQLLAEIYSSELAEAQARYLTMVSEFEAVHQQFLRTGRLAEIGAASTQELERVRAEHTTHETDIEIARAQLRLLGMSNDDIAALKAGTDVKAMIRIRAPRAGVVTERAVNLGVNVEAGAALFRVVDLATVWVVAAVYEQDLAHARVGSAATVTTPALPGQTIAGQVSYVDPVVRPETRTASIRVEIPNPERLLKPGMYADVTFGGPLSERLLIPQSAIQTVGDRQVVYVVDRTSPGRFMERVVTTGVADGQRVAILDGLSAGEDIVTDGSFAVRAERERTGLRSASEPGAVPSSEHRVVVGTNGFEPSVVSVSAGSPVRLVFLRTTDATCAIEVVVPALGIKRALPVNVPVAIELPPQKTGDLEFVCGMNMFKGQLRVVGR